MPIDAIPPSPSPSAPLAGRVLVVASEGIVAEAFAVALSTCGVAARAVAASHWPRIPRHRRPGPAVVLVGWGGPAADTVKALVAAKHRVAVVAASPDDPELPACLDSGAEAVLAGWCTLNDLATVVGGLSGDGPVVSPIDPAEVAAAHRRGRPADGSRAALAGLTDREAAILKSLMAGRRAAQIARDDFVSLHTVRTQIRSMLRKLGVHSQVEAVAVAHRAGWSPAFDR